MRNEPAFYNLYEMPGFDKLSAGQQRLLLMVYRKHQAGRGTQERAKYVPETVRLVKWDEEEQTVNIYHKNGDWWHYTQDGTWY